MNTIDMFVAFGGGYISGLSIGSGYLFQAMRKFKQAQWSSISETAWMLAACVNILVCGLMSVFLIVFFVYGDQPSSPNFWPRMLLFVLGLILGASLVVFGLQQINKGIRAAIGKVA